MSTAVSPVTGVVVLVHSHAFIVTTPEGAEVLVHLGIDTVALGERASPRTCSTARPCAPANR